MVAAKKMIDKGLQIEAQETATVNGSPKLQIDWHSLALANAAMYSPPTDSGPSVFTSSGIVWSVITEPATSPSTTSSSSVAADEDLKIVDERAILARAEASSARTGWLTETAKPLETKSAQIGSSALIFPSSSDVPVLHHLQRRQGEVGLSEALQEPVSRYIMGPLQPLLNNFVDLKTGYKALRLATDAFNAGQRLDEVVLSVSQLYEKTSYEEVIEASGWIPGIANAPKIPQIDGADVILKHRATVRKIYELIRSSTRKVFEKYFPKAAGEYVPSELEAVRNGILEALRTSGPGFEFARPAKAAPAEGKAIHEALNAWFKNFKGRLQCGSMDVHWRKQSRRCRINGRTTRGNRARHGGGP